MSFPNRELSDITSKQYPFLPLTRYKSRKTKKDRNWTLRGLSEATEMVTKRGLKVWWKVKVISTDDTETETGKEYVLSVSKRNRRLFGLLESVEFGQGVVIQIQTFLKAIRKRGKGRPPLDFDIKRCEKYER
jgi:hypothetical protein